MANKVEYIPGNGLLLYHTSYAVRSAIHSNSWSS